MPEDTSELQSKIESLEDTIGEQADEINTLQSSIEEKDYRITELEEGLNEVYKIVKHL